MSGVRNFTMDEARLMAHLPFSPRQLNDLCGPTIKNRDGLWGNSCDANLMAYVSKHIFWTRTVMSSRVICCTFRTSRRLFDHLVGTEDERLWNREADRLRGLQVDHQLKCGWLLDRHVTDFLAA